ncbi:hypothetical protein [Photorhabdus sp. SF281]|uniref:hypothetical protein n=1 Tax=Photorhabdus sp. SF281 TaxID=3459527 RepID=UPI00404403CD
MIRNSGRFSGAGLKALEARIREMGKKKVVVGVPAATNSLRDDDLSNVTIAAAHEFGATIKHPGGTRYDKSSNGRAKFVSNSFVGPVCGVTSAHEIVIPERSFLRSTLDENKEKAAKLLANSIRETLLTDGDKTAPFALVGEKMAGEVKRKIQAGINPALNPKTVKRKGSSKPLIDTGQLVQSITYEVREDG